MVRLLLLDVKVDQRSGKSFNPTMVRLLRACEETINAIKLGFNPTMVRLLLAGGSTIAIGSIGFNPTMVRLLQALLGYAGQALQQFQSHNGAIAAACIAVFDRFAKARFNPTMVRLLLCITVLEAIALYKFQSHNGAIAASAKRRRDASD